MSKFTPTFPRLDFHVADNAEKPTVLLIEEESGLMVAEGPNSNRTAEDFEEIALRCNVSPALYAALKEMEDIGTEAVDDIEEAGYPVRADRMVKAVTQARAALALVD